MYFMYQATCLVPESTHCGIEVHQSVALSKNAEKGRRLREGRRKNNTPGYEEDTPSIGFPRCCRISGEVKFLIIIS